MKLLVPVDFSDVTPRLVEAAIAQAEGREAHVWLVHAVEPEPDFVGYDAGPDVVRDQVAHQLREERHQLEELTQELRAAGITVTATVRQAPVVDTILAQADAHDVDLIIMGTHGRGVVYQVLVGSVSEGVLHRTRRPVLFVPAKKAR